MTTIFFRLAKEIILKALEDEMKRMKKRDESLVGRITTNKECSNEKRRVTDAIKTEVNDFNALSSDQAYLKNVKELVLGNKEQVQAELSDEVSKEVLGLLIDKCMTLGIGVATVHQQNAGQHPNTMIYINTVLKAFYKECHRNGWLDTKYDPNDPLSIYRYHVAKYQAQTIVKQLFKKTKNYTPDVTHKKLQLALAHLKECERALKLIDRKNELYTPQVITKMVLKSLKDLETENAKLCETTTTPIRLPLPIGGTIFGASIKAGKIKASRGELLREINQAISTIEQIEPERIVDSLRSDYREQEVKTPPKVVPKQNTRPPPAKKMTPPPTSSPPAVEEITQPPSGQLT